MKMVSKVAYMDLCGLIKCIRYCVSMFKSFGHLEVQEIQGKSNLSKKWSRSSQIDAKFQQGLDINLQKSQIKFESKLKFKSPPCPIVRS